MSTRALLVALALAALGYGCRHEPAASVSAGPMPVELEPLARYTHGDPIALALTADRERLWRVDGAHASEWRVDGARLERLRGFDVVGPVFALVESGERLFLACGERGLLAVDLRASQPVPRTVWREERRWCTDVELADGRLWSTFAALDDSRLVALDAAELAHERSFALPEGTAWAVAARGERAWVALGQGGLARVDLADGSVEAGPALGDHRWRRARDVALSDTHLAAACDGLGAVLIALDAPWGPETPFERVAHELDGRPTYAVRVAADGARLAVGTNLAPVAAQEGAPYGLAGWIDAPLRVGGVDPADYEAGSAQGWFLFERAGNTWHERARATGRGGWRSLALAGGRSFEQHVGAGLIVRDLSDGSEVLRDAPAGLAVLDAVLALDDPDLVLPANDSAGSSPDGWPRLADVRLSVDDATRGLEPLGLLAGPQWRDEAGGTWCLFGTPVDWRLWRIDAAEPRASRSWPVTPPLDGDGERGASYFSAALAGDLLVLSRVRSREGVLVASARALVERALATPPGEPLALDVRAALRTHDDSPLAETFAWRAALDPVRGLAVVPCGWGPQRRARWLVFDLTAPTPELLSEITSERVGGHALACALDGTRCVLLDLAGELITYDLADPRRPRWTGHWEAPLDALDERPTNLLGLALEPRPEGTRVWVAAGRAGLVHLALGRDGSLTFERRLPTDGWAASVHRAPGGRILVGDQKGGARVYAP